MRLPEALTTPESRRICEFLRSSEQNARQDPTRYELTLYGSAAVSLYLGDEPSTQLRFTQDIDVHHTSQLNEDTLNAYRPQALKPLHFQLRPLSLWLLHPDWEQDRVEYTAQVGLERWRVMLLSPRDLILSKLIRYIKHDEARDFDDCLRLTQRYLTSQATFTEELEEAMLYMSYLSEWEMKQLRYVPEELFGA